MASCEIIQIKGIINNPNLPIMTVVSQEVKNIMAHYSVDTDGKKAYYLQQFFDTIGTTLKGKIRNMILPLFASTTNEAIYDIIKDASFTAVDGSNELSLNTENNRLRITGDAPVWPNYSYQFLDTTSDYAGLQVAISNFEDNTMLFGATVGLNDSAVGEFMPETGNNQKVIGGGVVTVNGTKNIIRLGDSEDKLTVAASAPAWFNAYSRPFGSAVSTDASIGVRVLVVSEQVLTVEEAQKLRDAVVSLDSKFYD